MSKEYLVLLVDGTDPEDTEIDGKSATVFMRFTEQPKDSFLLRLAQNNRGKRVFCLMGASTWFQE